MSGRRVVSAKAAGNAGRHKPSLVNTNLRGQVIKPKSDRNDDEGNSMTWWKETAGQLSPILSTVSLLALYGITLYLPFLTHQSVQFVVCCFLMAISLLVASHYMTAKEHKKVTNTSALLSMSTLPRNVKKNHDGSYTIIAWRPSAYTENLFLSYNPLVPALAYIWVRSFEPFSSWLCVALMLISSALLHLLNARIRISVNTELLLLNNGSESRNFKSLKSAEENLPSKLYERGADNDDSVEEPSARGDDRGPPMAEEYEFNGRRPHSRYDGPASAIFQVTPETLQGVDPIKSQPTHSPEAGMRIQEPIFDQAHSPYLQHHQHHQHHHHQWEKPQQNYMADRGIGYNAASFGSPLPAQLSPTHDRAQPQTPGARALGGMGGINAFQQPPTTPQPRTFGLRFGASAAPQAHQVPERHVAPPSTSMFDAHEPALPSKHKVLVMESEEEPSSFGNAQPRYPHIPDQSPPKILSPGRHNPTRDAPSSYAPLRFGASATPSKNPFGAPPSFSMLDD